MNKYAINCGLETSLVLAIVKTESGFDQNALSKVGAVGLMQLMPSTAEWICEKYVITQKMDLNKPEDNIRLGCLLLRYLLDNYAMDWALAAYNAGQGRVDIWIKEGKTIQNIPYTETVQYVQKVKSAKRVFDIFV